MSEKEKTKHGRYGILLLLKIQEFLAEEGELSLERIIEEGGETDFLHALANTVPCYVYQKLSGENVDVLEFNHIANKLCFQYGKKETVEK